MKETEAAASDWRPEEARSEEDEVTHPIRIICARGDVPRNPRAYWLKKKDESEPRTPDWTEIGDKPA